MLTCLNFICYAQDEKINKNTASINGGTTLLVYSRAGFNYERLLKSSDKRIFSRYYLNAGLGRFVEANGFAPAPIPYGIETALQFIVLTGTGANHLELGTGLSVGFVTFYKFPDPNQETENTITKANFLVGYRFQEKKGMFFRVGAAYPIGLYMGIGVSF
ncbi:hypothetical protein SAMN05661096_03355 [Marivirga sericea]|uniref:Outer membrane protein beta-barrel domain-containing protein n=2 Tax=Marivirga sericea TaxID=1028 RepID=A0A1X7L0V9_9BACT|nr:hypothetical protein SAMN05661096_03355 [Marivirga sericea]